MSHSPASALPLLLPRESRRAAAPFLSLKAVSVRTVIWSVLLGIGIITPLGVGLSLLPLPTDANSVVTAQQRWIGYLNAPGLLFLKAVLIVPLIEEVFYRGLILQLLRRYTPTWFAIAFSAGFFGLTHLGHGHVAALNACVLGVVFSWLVIHTRSLLPAIVCHSAINFAWLFLITPGFGLAESLLAVDPAAPMSPHPLTLFPPWWLLLSVTLVIVAGVMLRPAGVRPAHGQR